MNYTIYCDLDGVLCDFNKGYKDLTGVDTSNYVKGDKTFWQPITDAGASFWANLEWMPDGQTLWNYIKKYKPQILSAPSKDPGSKVGKEAWCKMHMPGQYEKLNLVPRFIKQRFSKPGKILIDDMEETILEWNKKGGIGIHHTSATTTIFELKKLGL